MHIHKVVIEKNETKHIHNAGSPINELSPLPIVISLFKLGVCLNDR